MTSEPIKPFRIYHWDTFDNEIFYKHQTDTLEEAEKWVEEEYKDRISEHGADQVDIVSFGVIKKKYSIK